MPNQELLLKKAKDFYRFFMIEVSNEMFDMLDPEFTATRSLNSKEILGNKAEFKADMIARHLQNVIEIKHLTEPTFTLSGNNKVSITTNTMQKRKGAGIDETKGEVNFYHVNGTIELSFTNKSNPQILHFKTKYSKTNLGNNLTESKQYERSITKLYDSFNRGDIPGGTQVGGHNLRKRNDPTERKSFKP